MAYNADKKILHRHCVGIKILTQTKSPVPYHNSQIVNPWRRNVFYTLVNDSHQQKG